MLYRALIVSEWTTAPGPNGAPANVPRLAVDFPAATWSDAVGQPAANLSPAPNEVTLDCLVDGPTLEALDANPLYEIIQVTLV